mgnify:CR=1 FL=1
MAGSIPLLFKNNGTNVPTKPATIITATRETEIASAVSVFPWYNQTKKNKKIASITPFKAANNISFSNLLLILPFTSSLARPCTIIADDCTPTFPAIEAISERRKYAGEDEIYTMDFLKLMKEQTSKFKLVPDNDELIFNPTSVGFAISASTLVAQCSFK